MNSSLALSIYQGSKANYKAGIFFLNNLMKTKRSIENLTVEVQFVAFQKIAACREKPKQMASLVGVLIF